MVTTPDGNKLTVRRLIALIAVCFVSVGVITAATTTGTVIEDFESGDFSDWEESQAGHTIDDTIQYEGTYSMRWDGSSSRATQNFSDGTTDNFIFWTRWEGYSGDPDDYRIQLTDSSGTVGPEIHLGDGTVSGPTGSTQVQNLPTNEWFQVIVHDINYSSDTYEVTVEFENGTELGSGSGNFNAGISDIEEQKHTNLASPSAGPANFDFFTVNAEPFASEINGTVTDQDGDPIEGANVTAVNNSTGTLNDSDLTNSDGEYTLSVGDGNYNVTAGKNGYINKTTENVTVADQDVTVDFHLTETTEALTVRVKRFLEHEETAEYEVIFTLSQSGTAAENRTDITDSSDLTVTSNNTSIFTVDEANTSVVATSTVSVNDVGKLYANYTYQGDTYSANETIFVGNITLENFQQLPPWGRAEAVIGSQVDNTALNGENATWILIMAGAMLGAVLRINSTYLGLAGFELVIIAGWIMGKTGDGVLLISLAAVGFVALNLAANIDYGVR